MKTVVSCNGLWKNYGRKAVLKGVDLQVPTGNIFALLGTNGAGKTTLIRTLLGLIPKSGGEVRVLGAEPYQIGPSLRLRIGYVSEEQGLYSWMRVADIIKFCRTLYQVWDDDLVTRYLVRFRLEPQAKIGTLSKGQTVKLALILALAPQPELLILDEPMTGLDPLAQHEFLQVIMRDLNLEGRTIFFSTHNLADVNTVANQVAILYDGTIRATGSIKEICKGVTKLRLIKDHFPSKLLNRSAVTLTETNDSCEILLATTSLAELAATSETPTLQPMEANLEEAFLFYCSGGGLK